MKPITFLFSVVILAALCIVTGAAQYELLQVQVVHRHGARSALVGHNHSAICGYTYPCGYLNVPGQRMLVNAGRFLRHRYTEDTRVVSTPFLSSTSYNLTETHSRSTDVLRTLQSSDALLRGLFPDMDAYYPAVHTVHGDTDSMLNSGAIMPVYMKYRMGAIDEQAAVNPIVDKHFPDFSVLRSVAAEVHSEGFCSKFEDRTECAKLLCDIAAAYESTGDLAKKEYKLLRKNYKGVCAATERSTEYLLAFNTTDPTHLAQGSLGQQLAQQIISNMRAHVEGKSAFKLYEYSAHDTTITPLASTLGDNSHEALMPPFGSMFIFELLSSKVGDLYVRVLRGHPGLTPDTDYEFALSAFDLRCTSRTGKTYIAADNTCLLDDFVRFVDSSKPRQAAGLCYLDPVMTARMGCPTDASGALLSEECAFYRHQCPEYACGKGLQLNSVDNHCYAAPAQAKPRGISSAIAAVLAIGMFVAGVVSVLVFMAVKNFMDTKNRREAYDIELI